MKFNTNRFCFKRKNSVFCFRQWSHERKPKKTRVNTMKQKKNEKTIYNKIFQMIIFITKIRQSKYSRKRTKKKKGKKSSSHLCSSKDQAKESEEEGKTHCICFFSCEDYLEINSKLSFTNVKKIIWFKWKKNSLIDRYRCISTRICFLFTGWSRWTISTRSWMWSNSGKRNRPVVERTISIHHRFCFG